MACTSPATTLTSSQAGRRGHCIPCDPPGGAAWQKLQHIAGQADDVLDNRLARDLLCQTYRRHSADDAFAEQVVVDLGGRVAMMEGRLEENAMRLGDVRDAVRSLENRFDTRFEGLDRRFEGLDRRFEGVERRFEQLELRMDRRFEGIDRRFDSLDRKVDSHFRWLIGMAVASLGTMVGLVLRQ